jgi:hypothetical protein
MAQQVNQELATQLTPSMPSMRETVGTGNHKMAGAMVKAPDTLCDAGGSNEPIVAADMA